MNDLQFSGEEWAKTRDVGGNGQNHSPLISATPFVWRDPASIPPRAWLYGRHYIRQFLTCTIASGGIGKTSLAIGETLAMASGRPLLGIQPAERCRVWLWNGEDPRDELDRRIIAAMQHHNLTAADIGGVFVPQRRPRHPDHFG